MKKRYYCSFLLFFFLSGYVTAQKFTPLFNGKDLAGWESAKGGPAGWAVENGELVDQPKAGDIRTAEKQKADSRITWILLFHRDTETSEIRCELSLPARMNNEGQVDEWKERIILTAIPFGDGVRIRIADSPTPYIEIDVKRRA